MCRPVVWLGFGVLCVPLAALSGCESGSFLPPPPPALNSPALSPPETAAKVVELVLVNDETPDRRTWTQVVRTEANLARVGFRTSAPAPGDPPRKQAELIKAAVARGASVLIVEPVQDPKVAEALEQVRAQGTPVVLLDRPLAAASAAKPFPLVTPGALGESARKLVDAGLEDVKKLKLPADGKAIIVVPKLSDVHTADVVAAFQEALKGAGVTPAEMVEFDGTGENATKNVAERIKADPKLTLVLAVNTDALTGSLAARDAAKDTHVVVVVGYTEISATLNELTLHSAAAVGDRGTMKLANRAFRTALRLAEGEAVDERTEIKPTVRRFFSRYPEPPPPNGPRPVEGFPANEE